MKSTTKRWFLIAMLALCGTMTLTSCIKEEEMDMHMPERSSNTSYSTSLLVATDRHEAGAGNNLSLAVQMAVSRMDVVVPRMVLLGGDYVGRGPDRGETGQPAFTLDDLRNEIYRTLPESTELLFTYGSHDRGCTDGYDAFFSGPHRSRGYYVYGISYAQMTFSNDSIARASIALYEEQGDDSSEGGNPPAEGENPDNEPPADSNGVGERPAGPPPSGAGVVRAYNGIDAADPFGVSAESATKRFTAWASSLSDEAPIVVMSHVPMHANRGDNPGAIKWFEALSRAAEKHDIILFFGHNHSLEERGNDKDQQCYLLTPGDSISVQCDSTVERMRLNFTYANAGYLKLGWCTMVTFTDIDGDGQHDAVHLRRFSTQGEDDTYFGQTNKRNPFTIKLRHQSHYLQSPNK